MPADRGARVIGVDGGGTATRIAVAEDDGRELLRRTGAAGLIDPRKPAASATALVRLIREVAAESNTPLPVGALCAGLAGAGATHHRDRILAELATAGVADRLAVIPDGEIALEGALAGTPGILLIAGTGSGAWGRGEDGRVARCGGWGMVVGDEGSGYAIARAALRAVLRAEDGRGEATALLPPLLAALDVAEAGDVPARIGAAEKAEIAALAPLVFRQAASGDGVAAGIVDHAVTELARHVKALIDRLGPWSAPVPVVFHGGVFREPALAESVESRLGAGAVSVVRREAAADAVTGAVRVALDLVASAGRQDPVG